MGRYDSSLTRVQPAFRALAARSTPWVERLLRLGSRAAQLPLPSTEGWAGPPTARPVRFEHPCPPPLDYARWLLDDVVATGRDPSLLSGYGQATRTRRQALIGGDTTTVGEAHALLSKPNGNRGRGWHLFEGTTMVDCALFFERATVFIEGKRTERHLTAHTRWHDRRHQVVRNLDCLRAEPGRSERWYVLTVIAGDNPPLLEDARAFDGDRQAFTDALPHLDATAVDDVRSRYLGFTTWEQIRDTFGLPAYPDTV